MSADPIDITEELEAALDGKFDTQYEFYLASVDHAVDTHEEAPSERLFQITDRSSADWALRKVLKAKRVLAEAQASHDEQVRAVMAQVDRLLEPIRTNLAEIAVEEQRTISFFESLLITYHRKLVAEDPRATSIKLAFGTLKSRQGQDQYEFGPEFIEWAKANEAEFLLRVKYEVAATEAKKAIVVIDGRPLFEGEEVPGVTWTTGERKFEVVAEPTIAAPKDGE